MIYRLYYEYVSRSTYGTRVSNAVVAIAKYDHTLDEWMLLALKHSSESLPGRTYVHKLYDLKAATEYMNRYVPKVGMAIRPS